MSFGENIRFRRKMLGYSQGQLAKLVKVNRRTPSASYISRVESGKVAPRITTVRSIARALGIRTWQLVAEMYENTEFWRGYLDLSAKDKRNVQRHIDWLLRKGG